MRLACFSPVLLWPLTVGLLLAAPLSEAQTFVRISAEIEVEAHRGDDTNSKTVLKPRTVCVICITGTNEWRVDHDYIQNLKTSWYFDGTNVFKSSRITQPMSEEMRNRITRTTRLATAPFEQAKSNLTIRAWISRDGHPPGDPAVNIAWLAFCSGPYLKGDTRLIPLPLDDLRHTRDRFAYTERTKTFQGPFGLPQTVDLFLSRTLFIASESAFDQEYLFGNRYTEWTKQRAESLQEGRHTFHYAVTAWTNFFGWNILLRFDFYQRGRSFEQNGDWSWRGHGRVKSVSCSPRPEGLFVPSLQQAIVDRRFQDPAAKVDAIIYTTTNSFLSSTNAPALQREVARKAKWAAAATKGRE